MKDAFWMEVVLEQEAWAQAVGYELLGPGRQASWQGLLTLGSLFSDCSWKPALGGNPALFLSSLMLCHNHAQGCFISRTPYLGSLSTPCVVGPLSCSRHLPPIASPLTHRLNPETQDGSRGTDADQEFRGDGTQRDPPPQGKAWPREATTRHC